MGEERSSSQPIEVVFMIEEILRDLINRFKPIIIGIMIISIVISYIIFTALFERANSIANDDQDNSFYIVDILISKMEGFFK